MQIPNSSPNGGWAFAGDYFRQRQELSRLEADRVAAYAAAADVEAALQRQTDDFAMIPLLKKRTEYYDEAARIEQKIQEVRERGLNESMEDDSGD